MNGRAAGWMRGLVLLGCGGSMIAATLAAAQAPVAETPDTPFKLASIDAGGGPRLAMVLGSRVLDIERANQHLVEHATVARAAIPSDMRTLIEQYDALAPRLYQIANYFSATATTTKLPFAWEADRVSYKAPIKYPWNLLAAAANYKIHAQGMAASGGGGFNAAAAAQIVPDRDAPIMFAKSPRSCIIDPGEPYYIVDGRHRTDYEGELAIVIGPRPAYRVSRAEAHDYVFGYSIVHDVSDRGSEPLRQVSMFPGINWFDSKSTDRCAPFGPVIVPKEFLPKAPGNLRIVTKVNGEVRQDGNTSEFIWNESHLIGYLTSRLTLYPGDVIATGTPAGTGAEVGKLLKPGDVVTIEIDGIGTLTTPFKALSEKPR